MEERKYKKYIVHYTGGMFSTATITAENKTRARQSFKGEFNPNCKITKIEEIKNAE